MLFKFTLPLHQYNDHQFNEAKVIDLATALYRGWITALAPEMKFEITGGIANKRDIKPEMIFICDKKQAETIRQLQRLLPKPIDILNMSVSKCLI
jgi:hypothetical protein